MNRPCYKGKPIASLEALGRILGIPQRRLVWMARNTEKLYRPGPVQIKSDGKKRETLNAKWCLKEIQGRINKHIFENVEFPEYLQGGIRDRNNPRDYIHNAGLHVGGKTVINEDIASFFPSITKEQIRKVWQYFFNFPPVAADCLTDLTTYQGCLPQGARTSTYLANLVLWDIEPEIFTFFEDQGIRYSRYVDDLTVSSTCRLSPEIKQAIIRKLRGLGKRQGYRLKTNKHRIESAHRPMHVHKLVVNRKISLPPEERSRIRAAVHHLSKRYADENQSEEYRHEFSKMRGRVNNLARLHPGLGEKYRAILDELRPA